MKFEVKADISENLKHSDKLRQIAVNRYYENPKHCYNCGEIICIREKEKPSKTRERLYCSSKCIKNGKRPPRFLGIKSGLTHEVVAKLISSGLSYSKIAKEYGVSRHTVIYTFKKQSKSNTSPSYSGIREGEIVECITCGRIYVKDRTKGHKGSQCNTCHTTRVVSKKIEILVEIIGNTCCKCGYNKCHRAIDYHHIKDKKYEISTAYRYKSIKDLKLEAFKCIPLCSNCHREFHYKMWNYADLKLDNLKDYQKELIKSEMAKIGIGDPSV